MRQIEMVSWQNDSKPNWAHLSQRDYIKQYVSEWGLGYIYIYIYIFSYCMYLNIFIYDLINKIIYI